MTKTLLTPRTEKKINTPDKESSSLGTPTVFTLLRSIQGGVERVLVSRFCTWLASSEVLGVVGSDWTTFVNVASSSRDVSMMSGDGCFGDGTRCKANEAVERQRGETSQLLVLKLKQMTPMKIIMCWSWTQS